MQSSPQKELRTDVRELRQEAIEVYPGIYLSVILISINIHFSSLSVSILSSPLFSVSYILTVYLGDYSQSQLPLRRLGVSLIYTSYLDLVTYMFLHHSSL